MTVLSDAEALRMRGFNVFPIRAGDKTPFMSWRRFQTERVTDREYMGWIKKYEDNNAAVATGAISGIVVLDIDLPELAFDVMSKYMTTPDQVTLIAWTPRGSHYYFRHPGFAVPNSANQSHMDIRGDGGYVVVPPSVMGTKMWQWCNPGAIIQPLPKWVIDLFPTLRARISLGDYSTLA